VGLLSDRIGAVGAAPASLPDPRKGKQRDDACRRADIVRPAFSLFFIGSPAFLACRRRLEKGRGRSNCRTRFAITRIPVVGGNAARTVLCGGRPVMGGPAAVQSPNMLHRT